MLTTNKLWLQLFAGEGGASASGAGEGGADAAPGETADAAGQQLRALGVPEEKIRRNRAHKMDRNPVIRNTEEVQEQAAAAQAEDGQPTEEVKPKYVWDDVMKDPDMNREMQKVVKAAKGEAKEAKANLSKLEEGLKKLARENGMDEANLDYEVLGKLLTGSYEKSAAEMGVSTEVAIKLDQQRSMLEQNKFETHMRQLEQQANDLKKIFPNFDLETEMKDPRFFRLTAPGMPFTVEDAYHAVHRKELEAAKAQAIKETTRQQIANSIAAGQRRPDESGMSGTAPSVTRFEYGKASREEREALKARIRRGEKIYPG